MTETMPERVARAIYERTNSYLGAALWLHMSAPEKASYLADARAAIEAMREPTPWMIANAGEEVHWGYSCALCGGLTEGWYALFDAALSETEGG